jgi:hypothetical protein
MAQVQVQEQPVQLLRHVLRVLDVPQISRSRNLAKLSSLKMQPQKENTGIGILITMGK